jgi:small subunit ribosomal protein S16
MLKIRLSMGGVRKRPVYKIVVADSRFPRDGRFVEKLGSFNPLLPKEKKERIKVESERIKYWISKGAKPTLRVSRILGEVNLFPMPKAGNNPLKAIPKKDRKKEAPKEGDKKEAPKEGDKKEAPKQEAKKEAPKQEAKKEAPKQEAKKEATKKEEAKGEKK